MKSFIWVLQKPVTAPCWAFCPVCKELTLFVSSNVLMQRVIVSVSRFLLTGSRLQTDFSRRKHREFNKSAQLKYAAFFFIYFWAWWFSVYSQKKQWCLKIWSVCNSYLLELCESSEAFDIFLLMSPQNMLFMFCWNHSLPSLLSFS